MDQDNKSNSYQTVRFAESEDKVTPATLAKEERERELKAATEESKILSTFFKDLIEKLPDSKKYNLALTNALTSNLEYDVAFLGAINTVDAQLKTSSEGKIELEDKEWLEGIRKKFSKLILLDKIVHASGLIFFREEIMYSYIESILNPVKRRAKEIEKDSGERNRLIDLLGRLEHHLNKKEEKKPKKDKKTSKFGKKKNPLTGEEDDW